MSNYKTSASAMNYSELCEAFEALNPYEKALFIDARLGWAFGAAICGEVHKRICNPLTIDEE